MNPECSSNKGSENTMLQPISKLVLLAFVALITAADAYLGVSHQGRKTSVADQSAQAESEPDALAELPRLLLDTSYISPPGRILQVAEGEDLQAAINDARPGDVIAIQPGATFTGNFILPAKSPANAREKEDWIVIRSAASDACLPAPGTRITSEHTDFLPKIISPNGRAAIGTDEGAHHYRLIGLEISVVPEEEYNVNLVRLGDGSSLQSLPDTVPHDLIVDRCYIHGNKMNNVARGIALNSARTAVIDSYISEIHGIGFDTQAICGWNGPGPFKIVNNYLEASGENIMFGGSDPSIQGLIPSDIEIRGNHLYKPLRWKVGTPEYEGTHWTIKNLLELKIAQRVLIEGNVLENNWSDAQAGFALVFKSVNQDGTAPWSVTRDVTFINNVVRDSDSGINLLGTDPDQPGELMKRIVIQNNLWENIDGTRSGRLPGIFLQISNVSDVNVNHNTVIHSGQVILPYGLESQNFVYTNNLSAHNLYGVKGDGAGVGNDSILKYFPSIIFAKNVLAGGLSGSYPANNFFPPSLDDVKFVSQDNKLYRLAPTSPYLKAGVDGKDLGCDFDALGKVMSKAVSHTFLTKPSQRNGGCR